MKDFEIVQDFFGTMQCTKCKSYFDPEGIILVREEENFFVVKITCIHCNQQVGLAIVGIASKMEQYNDLLEEVTSFEDSEQEAPPITYDDVIEAHNFFHNLGDDWMKHIKANDNDIDIDNEN